MRREIALPNVLYHHLFPHPTANDPPNFGAHLSKNLVGEVRIETARFYGGLETVEARYPGLNYSYPPHRRRLSQFPHHARLFRAFDELGLTESEIASICRWEGTLWARERYEKDEGCRVRDTTGDEIPRWEPRRSRRSSHNRKTTVPEIVVKREVEIEVEEVHSPPRHTSSAAPLPSATSAAQASQQHPPQPVYHDADADAEMSDPADDDDSSDDGDSVALDLNQRLLAAAEAQASITEPGVRVLMDAEWEQYFKEQAESGALASQLQQLQAAAASNGQALASVMAAAARNGNMSTVSTRRRVS